MSDMDKLCSGCALHEEHLKEHLKGLDNYVTCYGYLSKDIKCPCTNCLIKMMCRLTCSELTMRSWWYEYNSDRKHVRDGEED